MQTLTEKNLHTLFKNLDESNQEFAKSYPGDSPQRQAIHTVYGGAHLFKEGTTRKIGDLANQALTEHAPSPQALAEALQVKWSDRFAKSVYDRVLSKLKQEAVEDFRIDFEDGYGNRPDSEEDSTAQFAAKEVAKAAQSNSLPPFIGIRIKPLNSERSRRSIRTLDLFLTTLLKETEGQIPHGFVVTLPKITHKEQARVLSQLLSLFEEKHKLKKGSLQFEIMIETPQSILDYKGRSPIRKFIEASEGRCIAAHFGTYDYTAGCNITAAHQTMDNPVCDFAKHVMQVSLAGMPILLSDGATNVMPVGDTQTVHRAWRLSYQHIRHSLVSGFYQGWDLHPAQIPVRYATVYSFFLETLEASTQRLKQFVDKAAKATLLGDVFDDAATGQGLLNYFLRGLSCGAITQEEALSTGVTLEEFQGRSFLKIVENRS